MQGPPLVNDKGNSLQDQVNSLGTRFEKVCSSAICSTEFLRHKGLIEWKALERRYRSSYNIAELPAALLQ